MMNHAIPTPPYPPASAACSTRAAFATLDRSQQRLLEALLFDGQTCARLAGSIGASAADVRGRAGAAMLALDAALAAPDGARGGRLAAMLALRALDALDADEAELVDAMLEHQPAQQRAHAELRALVGELCLMVPAIAPSPCVLARLRGAIGDDADAN